MRSKPAARDYSNPVKQISPDKVGQNEGSLSLVSFLGGIVFTIMVVVMSDKASEHPVFVSSIIPYYFEISVNWLAGTGLFFAFSGAMYAIMLSSHEKYGNPFKTITVIFTWAGFIGLLMVLPLLLFPFSPVGAVVIFIIEIALLIITLICHVRGVQENK